MKNVSNNFKNVIKSGGPFFSYATVVLADGTSLALDSYDDFSNDGNSYSETGGSGFPLGVALSKQIEINLDNTDDRFSSYDFYGAVFTLYTEADLPDGTTERVLEGKFTVIDSVAPGDLLEIKAYDNMYKLDSDFVSKLTYPATLQQLWNELCSYYDLTNGSPSFANNDFTVLSAPAGFTGREMAGYIAQMAIGNAIVDKNGRLCIKSYDFTPFNNMKIISGGVFGDNVSSSIAGGVFGDGLSSSVSGGTFEGLSSYHVLSDFINAPDISTDDVKITGIQTTVRNEEDDEDTVLIYGTDEYALSISNPLITGKEQTAISMIGDALIGVTVRPFSGSFSPNPTIEFMDLVYVVDKKDNIYASFVTDNNFEYLGNSDISNGLEPPERNRSTYSGNATEVYRRVQQQINNQKNDFETAVDNLENQLQNASGLYETDETQPDGSTIYYFHNKPTLEESDTIIKITSQALAISTDGGESYPVGITVDGNAIVSILQTIGVNADWINAGALTVRDKNNNIIFQANMSTGQVIISGDHVAIGDQTASEAIQDALDKAQNAEDVALNARDVSISLSNDYQVIPVNEEGNYTEFPNCQTTVTVTYGSSDITNECVITTVKSDSITGSWDNETKTYTVTGLSDDSGWVDITATYLSAMVKTKRFSVTKLYAKPGLPGDDGRIYFLESSVDVIKSGNETMNPSYLKAAAYYRSGVDTSKTSYNGRFRVEESYDGGESWEIIYISQNDENEILHSLYTFLTDGEGNALIDDNGYGIAVYRDISLVRISLYAAGGTTILIDQQIYTVVKDVDSLTHDEIFALLTNNGQVKGIYKEGDQLYISFTYAKGGRLTLGGSGNGNGVLVMLDGNNQEVGHWNNSSWEMSNLSSGRSVRMIDGNIYLLLNDIMCGRIGAFRWGNNASDPEGTTYLTNQKYLGIGHYLPSGTAASDIVINNGLNPDGVEERIIFRDTARHQWSEIFDRDAIFKQKVKFGDGDSAYLQARESDGKLQSPEGFSVAGNLDTEEISIKKVTSIENVNDEKVYSGDIQIYRNPGTQRYFYLKVRNGLITGWYESLDDIS